MGSYSDQTMISGSAIRVLTYPYLLYPKQQLENVEWVISYILEWKGNSPVLVIMNLERTQQKTEHDRDKKER